VHVLRSGITQAAVIRIKIERQRPHQAGMRDGREHTHNRLSEKGTPSSLAYFHSRHGDQPAQSKTLAGQRLSQGFRLAAPKTEETFSGARCAMFATRLSIKVGPAPPSETTKPSQASLQPISMPLL
jgi:hypothetical protein